VLHATLDDCRKTVLGQSNRLRIGFLGGGLYGLTLPFVRHLRSKFHIDVEWVELSLLDQVEAIAAGKVDAALCRLPLTHDGLVQCTVLLEEKKKLVVPAGMVGRTLSALCLPSLAPPPAGEGKSASGFHPGDCGLDIIGTRSGSD
jgi:hypothetical protein